MQPVRYPLTFANGPKRSAGRAGGPKRINFFKFASRVRPAVHGPSRVTAETCRVAARQVPLGRLGTGTRHAQARTHMRRR